MKTFKARWEIKQNWQLLFPILGLFSLGYSSFKLAKTLPFDALYITIPAFVVVFYILLKVVLFAINKVESRWVVYQRWELIIANFNFSVRGHPHF